MQTLIKCYTNFTSFNPKTNKKKIPPDKSQVQWNRDYTGDTRLKKIKKAKRNLTRGEKWIPIVGATMVMAYLGIGFSIRIFKI